MKRLTIIGNVGRIPTERTSSNGKKYYEFSVAVNEKKDVCMWFSVLMSERFSNITKYLTKGRSVYVRGDFALEVYKGNPAVTLYADDLQLLSDSSKQDLTDVVDRKPTEEKKEPDVY